MPTAAEILDRLKAAQLAVDAGTTPAAPVDPTADAIMTRLKAAAEISEAPPPVAPESPPVDYVAQLRTGSPAVPAFSDLGAATGAPVALSDLPGQAWNDIKALPQTVGDALTRGRANSAKAGSLTSLPGEPVSRTPEEDAWLQNYSNNQVMGLASGQATGPATGAAKNVLMDAAGAAIPDAATNVVKAGVRALTPDVSPGTVALANKAAGMDIPLNMKQITPVSNPNYGGIAQAKQWTQNFSNTMGIDTPSVTAPVAKQAMRMNGQTMEGIANANGITVDQTLLDKITQMRQQASVYAPGSTEARWANKQLDMLEGAATDPSGVIDGPAYQKLTNFNSEISKGLRRNSNYQDLAYDMKGALDDAFTRTATDPAAVQAWTAARDQYRNSVLGKKLADKAGPDGILNPQGLKPLQRGNPSPSTTDLADVGQLLPKPTSTGGTTPATSSFKNDLLTAAGVAGGTSLLGGMPLHAAGTAALTEAGLLALRKYQNSQWLANKSLWARTPTNPLTGGTP